MPKTPAKFGKRGNASKRRKKALDTYSEKKRRGRKPNVKASTVRGRADNYRFVLNQTWERIWPGLSSAQKYEDVIQCLRTADIGSYALELEIIANLILAVVHDRKFPKRKREAQINFLADSIAGLGSVTPRSSRDICERERVRIKRRHHILEYEFWVKCSCGYKGRSRNHACPKCEAEIRLRVDALDASPIFSELDARST